MTAEVGEQMFEELHGDLFSSFKLGFNDYYGVIIWDLQAGMPCIMQ